MTGSDAMKRLLVRLLRIRPKIYAGAEKEKIRNDMIQANRSQDRDITTCGKTLIGGLELTPVPLANAGGWLIAGEDNPKDKILYYIHGGGFTGACTRERMPFVSYLVRQFGYNVFSMDYRLAPEFMQPCALYDCLDGYEWLLQRYSPENILLIGESAGGTLCLSLSLLLRDKGMPLPGAVYANSPVTQMCGYTDSYEKFSLTRDFIITKGILENITGIYFREEDAKDPYVSPLYAELHGLPPVFLTASACECLLDDGRRMADKLLEAGNRAIFKAYPDLCHAFIISPQMKAVAKSSAYPDLRRYIKEQLG